MSAALVTAAESTTSIDLPTVLRLAGANNLDVQIAKEKLTEARAASDAARAKYFPFVAPAITLRRHENNIQTVDGQIIDADKNSLAAGFAVVAQVEEQHVEAGQHDSGHRTGVETERSSGGDACSHEEANPYYGGRA